ncbi:MAG: hypothetical protein HRU09_02535 [Oligoflexales bacterium]|nr:hypothetical protein [Oligoflexales bacterium]
MNGKSLQIDFITWIKHLRRAKKFRQRAKASYLKVFMACFFASTSLAVPKASYEIKGIQKRILYVANRLMEELPISYVYGGSKVTSINSCKKCNECLLQKSPNPKDRLKKCPSCNNCSLDCSHFTQLVYKLAGLETPYLDTRMMISLDTESLLNRYHLATIPNLSLAEAGDLLVYSGHVVILERKHDKTRGDIIHATGGKDIRLPGQGIQRERNIIIPNFRGPLKRIVRHKSLIPGPIK